MPQPKRVTLWSCCVFPGTLVRELLILAVAFCAADGGALRQVLSERTVHPSLDWALRVRWLAEITEGLQRLHSLRPRALIHRDLKAANVLLSCGGGGSGGNLRQAVAKVSDFGVASFMETMASRASAGGVSAAAATSSGGAGGGATGTLAWKAPETFAGRYSTASDVFGLGVTAFELITRRYPYEGLGQPEITAKAGARFEVQPAMLRFASEEQLRQVWNEDNPLSSRRPDLAWAEDGCPPALLALVKRCWCAFCV